MVTRLSAQARLAVLGVYLLTNLTFPFWADAFSGWFGIPLSRSGFVVSVHEFICSMLGFVLLLSLEKSRPNASNWRSLLPYVFLCLALGDLAYGLDYYLLNHLFKKSTWILTHEIPYISAMGLLAFIAVRRATENLNRHQRKTIGIAIASLSALYLLCSYKMVLSFQFPSGYDRPTLNYLTSYTYGILQSLAMGGLLVASLRTEGTWEFLLWFLFISMNASDFALRYQDVGKHPLGTPMFEYGWEFAIAALSALCVYRALGFAAYKERLSASPKSLASIRVLIPLSTLGILALFISLNLLLSPYFQIANINTISGHALIFSFTWLAANGIGIGLSRLLSDRISLLTDQILKAKTLDDLSGMNGNLIELDPILSSLKNVKAQLSHSIQENAKMHAAIESTAAAAAVAHNIGSPLSSLELGIKMLGVLPEKPSAIIRQALNEMRALAQGFSRSGAQREIVALSTSQGLRQRKQPVTITQLATVLDECIHQKRFEYKKRPELTIDLVRTSDSRSLFSKFNRNEFTIAVSNLINNAVEAIPTGQTGVIQVELKEDAENAVIRITDNGSGIASEHLPLIGQPGASFGKPNGSGFGVFHAKSTIEGWRGSFAIFSLEGQGTEVKLQLPLCEPPAWHLLQLEIEPDTYVCVIDDDSSIHAAWDAKLSAAGLSPEKFQHFTDPTSFRSWLLNLRNLDAVEPRAIYLVDYDYKNFSENGLDLIEACGIASSSVLITGHASETAVINRCEWLGVRLVSKTELSNLEVRVLGESAGLSRITQDIPAADIVI